MIDILALRQHFYRIVQIFHNLVHHESAVIPRTPQLPRLVRAEHMVIPRDIPEAHHLFEICQGTEEITYARIFFGRLGVFTLMHPLKAIIDVAQMFPVPFVLGVKIIGGVSRAKYNVSQAVVHKVICIPSGIRLRRLEYVVIIVAPVVKVSPGLE